MISRHLGILDKYSWNTVVVMPYTCEYVAFLADSNVRTHVRIEGMPSSLLEKMEWIASCQIEKGEDCKVFQSRSFNSDEDALAYALDILEKQSTKLGVSIKIPRLENPSTKLLDSIPWNNVHIERDAEGNLVEYSASMDWEDSCIYVGKEDGRWILCEDYGNEHIEHYYDTMRDAYNNVREKVDILSNSKLMETEFPNGSRVFA